MEAFVYCWTDWKSNKLYLGWHKGDLNDGYICSSKLMLEQYNDRPNDFTRQIIATGSAKDMIKLESSLLKSIDAANDKSFYNMHNNSAEFVHNQPHTLEAKIKMSNAHKTRTNYAKGWKFTNQQKNKLKSAVAKFWNNLSTSERKEHIKKCTINNDINMKKSNSIKATCPHCNKLGQRNAMLRWHFDNCKEKENS